MGEEGVEEGWREEGGGGTGRGRGRGGRFETIWRAEGTRGYRTPIASLTSVKMDGDTASALRAASRTPYRGNKTEWKTIAS